MYSVHKGFDKNEPTNFRGREPGFLWGMTMQDWETRLNRFIAATDREILQDAGKVTAEIAQAHAESEFEKYRIVQDRLFESDFDRILKELSPEEDRATAFPPSQLQAPL